MKCKKVLDNVYEQEKLSLLTSIRIGLHLLVCPDCTREINRYEECREILHNDFFPQSPGLENNLMSKIAADECENTVPEAVVAGGFSTRGWVIAGIVLLVSLVTAFFGLDFNKVVSVSGMSFVLSIGITIGILLTCYGLLFIGSHLKELTERFGLKV